VQHYWRYLTSKDGSSDGWISYNAAVASHHKILHPRHAQSNLGHQLSQPPGVLLPNYLKSGIKTSIIAYDAAAVCLCLLLAKSACCTTTHAAT
jgi:hypothetical protein